jgi:hypothetical protein
MLCIMGIMLCKYRYYLEGMFIIKREEGARQCFFQCINISDVKMERIFEIVGILFGLYIDYTELGRSETVLFSNI